MTNRVDFNKNVPVSIIVVDDYPLMRQALRACLEREKDLQVIAQTGDGKEAVDLAKSMQPDVVIMDSEMPVLDGIEATKQIIKSCPNTNILIMTSHEDSLHIKDIQDAGAKGYLTKWANSDVVVQSVRKIAKGECSYPLRNQYVNQRDVEKTLETSVNSSNMVELSVRELSILKLVAKGFANKDIARALDCNLHSIKSNLTTIFIKLDATSRTEAVANSLKSGLLTLNDIIEISS